MEEKERLIRVLKSIIDDIEESIYIRDYTLDVKNEVLNISPKPLELGVTKVSFNISFTKKEK